MNKLLFTLILLVTAHSSFGQFGTPSIPNYLLAENANPVVIIGFNDKVDLSLEDGSITQASQTPPSDLSNDDNLFENIKSGVNQQLQSLGIDPLGYMNASIDIVMDQKEIGKSVLRKSEKKPYYAIYITIMDWANFKKKLKKMKGEFGLSAITGPSFVVMKLGSGDFSSMYIEASGKSLDQKFSDVNMAIKKESESYFLPEVDLNEIEIPTKNETDYWYDKLINQECSEVRESWPTKSELEAGRTLVFAEDYSPWNRDRHIGTTAMEQGFPFDYDYPEEYSVTDFYPQDYNYVIVPLSRAYEFSRTTTRKSTAMGTGIVREKSTTKHFNRRVYFFVIQDVETGVCYYGEDPKKLRSSARLNPSEALPKFLKLLNTK